ncbi:2-oxo-4-hydroxy-4-carboxy-5-ureidoimidazoline decarboxylase [Flaviflagellibacter deserti]|uniref:2-oxo-4-hydroxy-4-carboxy-5-ureidoimidazoline decarboxylase n=1 Tax=Flaviflagellibacter deserti TaxID=2267266 RepID=A0ABV9Z133_9HYPH
MTKIALEDLNAAPRDAFVRFLGGIFEHSSWIAEAAAAKRPFATVAELFAAMRSAVHEADANTRFALVTGHPDLAGKAARAGKLSAESAEEQKGLGVGDFSEAEFARFQQLNHAYRERFGFLFIICVRRHTKDSVLRQFEKRLKNSRDEELATALKEIERIAALRLDALVEAPDRLPVYGHISTHVLDTHGGRPAEGVAVELVEIRDSGKPRLITQAVTNADGRTSEPMFSGQPIAIGTYELRFDIGAYFARLNLADPPFLTRVPVRFSVSAPEGRYHVPLVVTPWSYSTYRGS